MTTASQSCAQRLGEWLEGYPDVASRRLLHRAPIGLWRLGLGALVGRPLVLLTTTGRTSGTPRRTPLMPHRVGGRLYVWNPYGDRAHWWRNLAVDPIVTLQSGEGTRAAEAVRIVDDAETIEVAYALRRFDLGLWRRYLDNEVIADDDAALVTHRDRLAIVRLDATTHTGPAPLHADLAWIWLVPVAAGLATTTIRRLGRLRRSARMRRG